MGYAGDDYVGTDTTNNFLYVYNGYETDYEYSPLPPPAIAYNLVQGPVVDSPGSTAMFDGRIIQDKKNLNIISSTAFVGGDPNLGDPPLGWSYWGSIEYYRFMKGLYNTGEPMIDPVTKKTTTFYAPGDPITQSGWIGGINLPPGDRRSTMTSGPFTMAPGDTQEVVYAITAAGGRDRLNSVKLLRYYNGEINSFYRNNLEITPAPPVVSAKASYDFNGINLNWGYDQRTVDSVENFNRNGYSFEGYNIYQLPSKEYNFKQDAIRLGTFDKNDGIKNISGIVMDESSGYGKPGTIQFGNDTGLKRSLLIVRDSLANSGVIKGKPYYFAVTGYYYNPNKTPNAIENIMRVFSVTYQDSIPGLKYADSLKVTHIAGSAGVRNLIYASIYNPQLMNGHTYHVTFSKKNTDPNYLYFSDFSWSLTDSTENKTLLTDQKNLHGNIIELPDPGIRIGVTVTSRDIWGYKHGFSDFEQTVKTDPNTNPLNLDDYSFGGGTTSRENFYFGGGDQATDEDYKQDLEFRFTGTRVTNSSSPEDTVISSGGSIATIVNQDYSISKRVRVPFELWEVERKRQINIVIHSGNRDGMDPWQTDGTPLYYRSGGWSEIVPVATDYNPNATVTDVNLGSPKATWVLFFIGKNNLYDGKKSHWDTGDKMVVHYTTPLGDGDVYSFTTPVYKAENGEVFNPTEYKLYQNYPNPFNPVTSIRYNLPQKGFVNIKVYNILGQLVKTLVNKDMNKGLYQADFNAASLASGVYIYTLSIDGKFYYAKKMVLMK